MESDVWLLVFLPSVLLEWRVKFRMIVVRENSTDR